jgi:hypothetical protein
LTSRISTEACPGATATRPIWYGAFQKVDAIMSKFDVKMP